MSDSLKPIPVRPRRILIDCTSTYRLDPNTGIQRVVRNIVNRAAELGRAMDIECIPVAFFPSAGFVEIESLASPAAESAYTVKARSELKQKLRRGLKQSAAALGLFKPTKQLELQMHKGVHTALRPLRRTSRRAVSMGEGDVLLFFDSTLEAHFWDEVRYAQSRGALVCLGVHDLIPLVYPGIFNEHTVTMFHRWWGTVSNLADFYICNSNSTWQEVLDYQNRADIGGDAASEMIGGAFQLGAELDGCVNQQDVKDPLRQVFDDSASRAVYLMVGLISPRKNYTTAIDAFEELWQRGSNVCLSIVGKLGWESESLVERIESHPQYQKRLFWFDDVNDGELDYCYRHSASLITASYAEGFNLPIVESLSRGRSVLAADIPVNREVGGEFAAYFPAHDSQALATLIEQHQQTGLKDRMRSPDEFHWPDWSESCEQMLEQIVKLATECARRHATSNAPQAA